MLCAVNFIIMGKKYGVIKNFGDNLTGDIEFKDSDLHGEEYINQYYKVIFEAKDFEDFKVKKYKFNGRSFVIVKGVKFKVSHRISKYKYVCEDITSRGICHIPYFLARRLGGVFYVFYDFNFE